jgi:uncharacterized membrane protein
MTDNPQAPGSYIHAAHPVHPAFTSFPTACFAGTLLTDIVYWKTAEMQWANFSAWMLLFGLVMAGFAVIAGIVDALAGLRIHGKRPALVHVIGNIIAIALAILNSFVHSRDAYTSVVPLGILISFITVIVLAVTGWWGHEDAYVVETRR